MQLDIPVLTPLLTPIVGALLALLLNIPTPNYESNLIRPTIESAEYNFYYTRIFDCNNKQLISQWGCKPCKLLPTSKFVDDFSNFATSAQGYVAIDDNSKHIVVVFRGTNDILDVVMDILVVPVSILGVPHPPFAVNAGFMLVTESVKSQFMSTIKQLYKDHPDYKLKFVGHSLGGAMATIALIKTKAELGIPFDRFELFTYGSPRIGDSRFAKWFNLQDVTVARTVNYNDLIPDLPPRLTLDYTHIGNEVFINPKNITDPIRFCSNDKLEDISCSAGLLPHNHDIRNHVSYFQQKEYAMC